VRRWLLLAATLWPVVYVLFFFVVVAIAAAAGGGDPDGELPVPFALLITLHLLTMLIIFALLAIYMVDVFRNPDLPEDRRVLWAVVIFLGSVFAMPVYWWLYKRPPRTATG
jgi:hypothetical protein